MNTLKEITTPQLEKIHSGKVRESFRVGNVRLIASTNRISCFNKTLSATQPNKGAILNQLSAFWFEKTTHIIPNAFLKVVDPNMCLMKEATPLRVEMIVRGFLTGSIWRQYIKGERTFSGVTLPDGLSMNDPFPKPILTPTTKCEQDRGITPDEIVSSGLVEEKTYQQMAEAALELFNFGSKWCADKGLILVDTKYEFGLIGSELVLIDEIHTPDSSRFWKKELYEAAPDQASWMDKEYIRQALLDKGDVPSSIKTVPSEIVYEAAKRYQWVYEAITGKPFEPDDNEPKARMARNLVSEGIIKDGYVALVLGSKSDFEHAMKIKDYLDHYNVMVDVRVLSAHKNGEAIPALAAEYNHAIEPGAVIAIAGRSNGLGGALAANLAVLVINCPPFKDKTDCEQNINSSLMMPSNTPAVTCVDTGNAALAALRALNTPRLRELFCLDIEEVKAALAKDDLQMKKAFRSHSVKTKEAAKINT